MKIELITVMVLGLTENTQVSIAVYFMTNVSEYLTCMDMDIWAMFTTASKSSWKVYSTTELKKRYTKQNKELQAKTHGADRLIIQHSLLFIALLHLYFRIYAPDLVKTRTKFQMR